MELGTRPGISTSSISRPSDQESGGVRWFVPPFVLLVAFINFLLYVRVLWKSVPWFPSPTAVSWRKGHALGKALRPAVTFVVNAAESGEANSHIHSVIPSPGQDCLRHVESSFLFLRTPNPWASMPLRTARLCNVYAQIRRNYCVKATPGLYVVISDTHAVPFNLEWQCDFCATGQRHRSVNDAGWYPEGGRDVPPVRVSFSGFSVLMGDWGLATNAWGRGGVGWNPTPSPRPIVLSLALSLPSATNTKWRPWTLVLVWRVQRRLAKRLQAVQAWTTE